MTLNAVQLRADIEQLCGDMTSATTAEDGSRAKAAERWASAMGSYAQGLSPPSGAIELAAGALRAALALAFAEQPPQSVTDMEIAFRAFGAALALGQAAPMAPPFAGVGPPGDVGFVIYFGNPSRTRAGAAELLAQKIALWMTTGTATSVAGFSRLWQ